MKLLRLLYFYICLSFKHCLIFTLNVKSYTRLCSKLLWRKLWINLIILTFICFWLVGASVFVIHAFILGLNHSEYLDKHHSDEEARDENYIRAPINHNMINTKTFLKFRKQFDKHNKKIFKSNGTGFPNFKRNSAVFVILAHSDFKRIAQLIVTLMDVEKIEETLIIFSHSYYMPDIDSIVKNIPMSSIIQIYYPYSVQLHPYGFPGPDNCKFHDCTARNAKAAERKHHWWWTANFVFEKLQKWLKFQGPVIFLEEHHYVTSDVIYILNYMQGAFKAFPNLDMFALGRTSWVRTVQTHGFGQLNMQIWQPHYHGVVFNSSFWSRVSSKAQHFCLYDDVDWRGSLYNVTGYFRNGHALMLTPTLPRVRSSSLDVFFTTAVRYFGEEKEHWFPTNLFVSQLWNVHSETTPDSSQYVYEGLGGWSDFRDHLLCAKIRDKMM